MTGLPRIAATVAVLLVAACGSTYLELRSESEIPDLARLAEMDRSRPQVHGLTVVGEAAGEPVRIAWRETSGDDAEWLVVLVHGVLTDGTTWRFMAGDLGRDHDLLVLHLPGCGDSDKPAPDDVAADFYTPTGLGRAVYRLIRERLAAREHPPRLALVGHSLGTLVLLRMLGDPGLRAEFDDVRVRVERTVLLSPIDVAIGGRHAMLESIADLSGLLVGIGSVTGILREETATATRDGLSDGGRAVREDADRTAEILEDGDRRRAAQEMIRRAVPHTEDERLDWPRIDTRVREYGNVDMACLILVGARDELFPVSMSYRIRALLPDAWLHVFDRTKHAIQTEHPERCAAEIRRFLETGGAGESRIIDDVASAPDR